MALVATSVHGPGSSWFSSLSETDPQDFSMFSTKCLKQIDSATIKFIAQAAARNMQLATDESTSMYACRLEDLVNKGWPELYSKMINREYVNFFIRGVPIKLNCLANEKKLDHNPTVDETVIPFQKQKNFVKREHLAYEMTPKSSNEVNHLKPNFFLNNEALKHVFKQTQTTKNHRSLLNSAKIATKVATLSRDVLNDKLKIIVKSV